MGSYHKSMGEENQDRMEVIKNVGLSAIDIFMLSDGAGSSPYGGIAAEIATRQTALFCKNQGEEFFSDTKKAVKKLIFDIQNSLAETARKCSASLSDMKCTLIILGIDKEKHTFFTVNVGDGAVCKMHNDSFKVISYPENGITKQYTFFVNSPNVFNHLFVNAGRYKAGDSFFAGTDGCFENCRTEKDYFERIHNIESLNSFFDDISYCIIKM
jgi:hypothetical protein